jgi:putative membrane protein
MSDERTPTTAAHTSADINTELAMRRTGMAFQRTRLAADRTLMAVIRTSLSLISFGFTIFQFLSRLQAAGTVGGEPRASRNFGMALVWLGIGMLVSGIVYQLRFMKGLRDLRASMKAEGLVHGESHFPTSATLIIALLLLALGIVAIVSMSFHVGPFD